MQWSMAAPRTLFRVACAILCAFGAVASIGCTSGSNARDPAETAGIYADRADDARQQGRASLAARQYEQAALAASEADDPTAQIDHLLDAAECWLLDGKPSVAAVNVERAERVQSRLPPSSSRERHARMRLATLQGDLAFVAGDRRGARRSWDEALSRALGRDRDPLVLRQSLLAEREGDTTRARNWSRQATDPRSPLLAELRRMLSVPVTAAPTARAPAPVAAPAPAPAKPVAVPTPPVLPRSAWGARRMRANIDRMTPIWRITVHHSGTRLSGSSTRVAADAIKGFQRQHQDEEGWADIGYHFLIDPSGRIWEGRPVAYQGAHAGSPELNVGNLGVALIGDFTVQQPTASQKKALADLLSSLCAKYRVERKHVYTHQEVGAKYTDCPGPALQRVVEAWRRGALKI